MRWGVIVGISQFGEVKWSFFFYVSCIQVYNDIDVFSIVEFGLWEDDIFVDRVLFILVFVVSIFFLIENFQFNMDVLSFKSVQSLVVYEILKMFRFLVEKRSIIKQETRVRRERARGDVAISEVLGRQVSFSVGEFWVFCRGLGGGKESFIVSTFTFRLLNIGKRFIYVVECCLWFSRVVFSIWCEQIFRELFIFIVDFFF